MAEAEFRSIVGLIPARGGSKGIPRKNLRPLAGRPLIEHTCLAARASRRLTRTIVSTDSAEIAKVARRVGVEVPFIRPAELATDQAPSVGVVLHALDWLRRHEPPVPDVVVLLQPTAPLRRAEDIDRAVALLCQSGADSVVSVSAVPADYHPDWQLSIRDGRLVSWRGGPLSQLPRRRQDLPSTLTRDGAIYAVRSQAVEATGSLYGQQTVAYRMDGNRSVNIDTDEDWQWAEFRIARQEVRDEAA